VPLDGRADGLPLACPTSIAPRAPVLVPCPSPPSADMLTSWLASPHSSPVASLLRRQHATPLIGRRGFRDGPRWATVGAGRWRLGVVESQSKSSHKFDMDLA
jgi:hypothetical protein